MAFAVARRYPSVLRRLVLAKRIPSVRRNVSFIASGLNRGVPSGTPRIAQLLPIRLKNCYATAAKSSEKKKASTKKRTTKKTTGAKAKKAVAKKKDGRGRKPLTEEQKEEAARKKLKRRIKMLKEAALTPPKTLPSRPHRIAFPGGPLAKGDNYYSRLSDAEKAKLSEQAEANKKANEIAYDKWVKSHSALDIKNANQARASLRRLKYHPGRYRDIKDDRQVKPVATPFTHFMREAHAMGELDGLSIAQTGVRLGEMWRSMTETEKDKYRKMHEEDRARYEEEYRRVYHEEPRSRSTSPTVE